MYTLPRLLDITCRWVLSEWGQNHQRTSGPVNAHLTPGPGLYFNAFIHEYSPRAGADNALGTNVDVNRKPLSFCPFVAGLKKNALKSDFYIHFFHVSPYEPPHDKTNKMACAPREDSDRPGHPASLIRVFAVSMKKAWVLSYPLTAQRRLWSDCADAQADQSLQWAHMPFCWFCHEAAQLYI